MKPCLEYTFAIKVGGKQEEATLELPTKLGPATPEQIAASRYGWHYIN